MGHMCLLQLVYMYVLREEEKVQLLVQIPHGAAGYRSPPLWTDIGDFCKHICYKLWNCSGEMIYSATVEQNFQLPNSAPLLIHWNFPSKMF